VAVDVASVHDLWTSFAARAELVGAAVVRADSEEALLRLLREANLLAVTESVGRRYPVLAREFARSEPGAANAEVVAVAEFAVAETGSLALNEPRLDRAACFLAERLWLLVAHDQVLATIDEAMARLAELTRAGARHPLLMSGPSRTADIERVLTIGVHGPRQLVAIVVDPSLR
jgi:L-lactate dehydrogenase complex protein LldG